MMCQELSFAEVSKYFSPSDWTYCEAELKRRLGKKFLIYGMFSFLIVLHIRFNMSFSPILRCV